MKYIQTIKKKIFLFVVLCFVWQTNVTSATIQWNPASMPTIPDDGNTYYIDFSHSLEVDLTINGTLEVWSGGVLNTDNENIYNNNTLTIDGGTLNVQPGAIVYNGYDGEGIINVISGSFLQLGGSFRNGGGNPGTIRVIGGSFNVTNGNFYNSYNSNSVGTLQVVGGMFTQSGGVFYNSYGNSASGAIYVSDGTCNISGGSFYNS